MPHKRAKKRVKRVVKKRKGARTSAPKKVKRALRLKSATPRKPSKVKKKRVVRKAETRKRRPSPPKHAQPHKKLSPYAQALAAAHRGAAQKKTAKKTPAKEREFQAALRRAVREAHADFKRAVGSHKKKLAKHFKDAVRKERREVLAPVRKRAKALGAKLERLRKEKHAELTKKKRKVLRQEMSDRSRAAVLASLAAKAKRSGQALIRRAKAEATKHVRAVREALFGKQSHTKLRRHIASNSAEWQTFVDAAEMSTKWDSKRIRDEFFSPKVRGKKR